VILPGALPQIITGMRIAMALCWALVVAAELIAAQVGLGYMIMDATTFFRIPVVYIGVLIIGVIGLALEGLFMALEAHFLHWRGKQ
jgi:NitT/TauT family transport system permease protein